MNPFPMNPFHEFCAWIHYLWVSFLDWIELLFFMRRRRKAMRRKAAATKSRSFGRERQTPATTSAADR